MRDVPSDTVEAGVIVSNRARGAGIGMRHHWTGRGSEHYVTDSPRVLVEFLRFFIFEGSFLNVLRVVSVLKIIYLVTKFLIH